jgi:hypothetical protein
MKIRSQFCCLTVTLTVAEAREVQKELNKLFEMEKTEIQKLQEESDKLNLKKEFVPAYPPPIIIDRTVPHFLRPWWEIWCYGTDTGNHPGSTLSIAVGQD